MRIRYGSLVLAGFLMLFVCGTCPAATDARIFPYQKEVRMPPEAFKKVAIFRLDEEIFAATVPGYSNMRVFDEKGNERPFVVRTAETVKAETVESSFVLETVGFEKLADNRIELVYKVKENDVDRQFVALVFNTSLKNYEKQVSVSGSNDCSSWEVLALNQPIFDYSKYIDLRNCRVAIKQGKYSYYRITVSNITETQQSPLIGVVREKRNGSVVSESERSSFSREDFRIDRIDFVERKETLVKNRILKRAYPVTGVCVSDNAKEKTTIITFEAGWVPLTGLKIVTSSSNFSRSVMVEAPEKDETGREVWNCLASSAISRIDTGGFKQENVNIGLNRSCRYGRYRITISNQDSLSLNVSGVEAEGEIHEAVFFPEQSKFFRVVYGAASLDAPRYDISEVLARVDGADADVWQTGSQKGNSDYNPSAGRRIIEGRRLLVVAVLLMICALVWIIYRTMKSVDSSGK